MIPITPATEQRLALLFPPEGQELVRKMLLVECGENIPGLQMAGAERLRIAVLKISDGNFDKLREAIDLAKIDLRDVLMWAGFGDPHACFAWVPQRKWTS